jgi:hypothetical protein
MINYTQSEAVVVRIVIGCAVVLVVELVVASS